MAKAMNIDAEITNTFFAIVCKAVKGETTKLIKQ